MTSSLNAPSSVSFANVGSTYAHFKAFTNFMTAQAKLHADKPFARYLSTDGQYKILSYSDVDRIATNLACSWAKAAQNTDVLSFLSEHNVNYLIIMLAAMKLRITLMALSPRNSKAANVDLMEKTNSKLLIANVKYQEIAEAVVSKVDGAELIIVHPLDIDALAKEPLNPDYKNILDFNFSDSDIKKAALIIHSSGTTSFPKPIYLSNQYLFIMLNYLHIEPSLQHSNKVCSDDVFLSCAPLFHIFGFFCTFSMATVGGSVVFLGKLPPSSEELRKAIIDNHATAMCVPPLILEQMIPFIKQTNDFPTFQKLKFAIFGGAPLKKEAGDWFQSNGINVRNVYGTTEIGPIMSSNLDPASDNWNSLRPYMTDSEGKPYGCFEVNDPSEPDVYHFYVRPDYPGFGINVSNREGGGYNTNDLFKESPDHPGYYTYIGRRDDTLIMENGEKTNPVPMEATLRQSHIIKQAAVLGHARQCTAALVELDNTYALDYSPEDIIDEVRKAIKQVNVECPSHSAILPQMVKILPFNKSLPSTDKGSVQRKKAEVLYQDIVDKMYADFLEGPKHSKSNGNTDTSTWTSKRTQDFLVTCVSEVLGLNETSDFKDLNQSVFDLGLNSLTAIQLRNRIAEHFDNVPQNFLFQHPSINAMCDALMSGETEDLEETLAKRAQQTQKLAVDYIKKAKADFPVASNNYDNKSKVVLLTGATGSLGSFMLEYLLKDTDVKKVYCCIRGKQDQLFSRLESAFKSRSLDTSLLSDRVQVLPMRFNEPFLGFGESLYNQLREEVTIVQHCAWLLDFNMPVDHYDKECIAPFYNLLKFAYRETNPMHVHFISSISASAAYGPEIPEEPLPLDASVTMPMGYAQSKFIVETLFDYLTTEKNFPCYIERLGQVCGDSVNGVWNTSEQFPLMFIGGGSVMHKMPALDTVIDWISVDYAAKTIVDIMLETAYLPADRDASVYHIVNPHLVQWSDVLEAMKNAGMRFETVDSLEWVETLAQDHTNPAYKLMSFYETNFKEAFKMPVWKTEKTSGMAPVLGKAPVLDTALFSKFLNHWQSVGFYNPSK